MELDNLLMSMHGGTKPPVFKELNYKLELEDIEAIETKIKELSEIMKIPGIEKIAYPLLTHLQTIQRYIQWIQHPIYLNEYKDKYGNIYLKGRTSIKDEKGKTKWINAYIGSINEYPNGVNDETALAKAKPLIRKKLKKYFGLV